MKREAFVVCLGMGLAAPPGSGSCRINWGTGGAGGGTTTSAASGGGAGGGDGGTAMDAADAAAECAGDATACVGPAECPAPTSDCLAAVCDHGCCSTTEVAPGTTCAAGVCDGNGACVQCNVTADCTGPNVCMSTMCVAPTCNDGIQNGDETDVDCGGGTCPPCANTKGCEVPGDCQSGFCSSMLCAACDADGQCAPGDFCDPTLDSGTCTPRKGQGVACAAADQCASGFCVDGFCCDAACSGVCQACSNAAKGAGADGTCGDVVAGGDSRGQCVDQGAHSCGTDGTCDGNGGCQKYPSGTVCVPATCEGKQAGFVPAWTCDGAGTCTANGLIACMPYTCNASGCLTSCASDADCLSSPPHYCDASGHCEPKEFPGLPCTSADQCTTSTCTDGVCCAPGCNGTCQTCAAAGAGGNCELVPAGANNPNHPCPSGGVCNGVGATSAACVQCVTDADCPAAAVCTSNVCLLSSGQPCSTGTQCASGVCTSPGNTCM